MIPVVYTSVDSMWAHLIRHFVTAYERGDADDEPSRAGDVAGEVTSYSAMLVDIERNWLWNPVRRASMAYAAGELTWYLSGDRHGDAITHYAPQYRRFLEDDGTAHGAYGHRWEIGDQITHVIGTLESHPNSRQAVITCWDASLDLEHAVGLTRRDLPCTVSLQFLVRDDKLHLIATMRSNDAWLGMPYDVWCFTTLQKLLASLLGYEFGTYTHQVGSMHLYSRNADAASAVQVPVTSDTDEADSELHHWSQWRRGTVNKLDRWRFTISSLVGRERSVRLGRAAGTSHRHTGLLGQMLDVIEYYCGWDKPDHVLPPCIRDAIRRRQEVAGGEQAE